MSNGSSSHDEEAGRGEDRLPFPIQESGDAQPTNDHLRSFIDQEIRFSVAYGTHPLNSPPGVFYSIRLPPSQAANRGYHSIRPPNNSIHFENYRPDQNRSYSDLSVAAAVDDDDDFGHSDLSVSLLGSYDAGFTNLREVSHGEENWFQIPVGSSLLENIPHPEVNNELYAVGPALLPLGDDSSEMHQTCRKSIFSVVCEGQEEMAEEVDIEQMSSADVVPPTLESTVSQRNGEQNDVNFENVAGTVPRQAASTSGYQTGTDGETGRAEPVDNLQTLVKRENQEPSQHPEQQLQPGSGDNLQVRPPLSPAVELASQLALHAPRDQEPQPGEEMDEESDGNN